jgi:hypothetical protein
VAHGDYYDHESVSTGEDNAGQIILALMSFRKLKAEYADYQGGLLLIDEADAGLFPTAQINLLKVLDRECRSLNLQVVMTSHSPVLIEYAFEQSKQFRRKYRTIYLSNSYGDVQVKHDWDWAQISADINTKTVVATANTSLPSVNVYFEDGEAEDFYWALMYRQSIKRFTTAMSGVTLGCSNYLQLIQKKVPEFSSRSLVCLDADQSNNIRNKNYKTVVLLPGHLPPDQLVFEHLYNLPADDAFWENDLQFNRTNFTNAAREVISTFSITGNTVDVKAKLATYAGDKIAREVFKRFYKNTEFQQLVSSGNNPWKHWIGANPALANEFLSAFQTAISGVMRSGYSVDAAKLTALQVKLKRV